MVGIESSLDLAEDAQKIKTAKVSEAERERQREFYAKLRSRTTEQPVGDQSE